jgi:hypothetical protein
MGTEDLAVAPERNIGAQQRCARAVVAVAGAFCHEAHLEVVAVELRQANEFVARHHRHHKPEVGHRFSIGVRRSDTGELCGVAIVGRPKARLIDQHRVVEVTRLVTDGTKNACSLLYASAARAAKAIGYDEIITYTLESEPGTSLRAVGWEEVSRVRAEGWSRPSRSRKPAIPASKRKWRRVLRGVVLGASVAREPDAWVLDAMRQALRSEPSQRRRTRRRTGTAGGVRCSRRAGVRCQRKTTLL